MKIKKYQNGFTLIEVLVAVAVFLIFSIGVYSGINMIFKVVYQSRMRILETSILSEELETVRNLAYDDVGIVGGLPVGVLQHEKTVNRNNKDFTVVTTVRNIDDPFDGVLGGAPNDTSPADYKLVEISAICQGCVQTVPVILSTTIAPKSLEGASENGALFITVFDADGQPVPGANVHVVNSAPEPDLIVDDITDVGGMLRIIDAPTGTLSYRMTVTKDGYSTDQTISGVPGTPTKPPSTVVTQAITDISFSIDRLGSLLVKSIDSACAAVGSVNFSLRGEKLIGTNPATYKYDQNFSTNAGGEKNFATMEWDKYHFAVDGAYDLVGSVPMLPLNLTPGLIQEVSLVVRPHTANSFLVKVQDAGTKLPLSNATVHLSSATYDKTIVTGLGYSRQTDWSGGSGQVDYVDEGKYFSDNGTLDINSPSGDVKLKKVGGHYLNGGWLESSTFDFGEPVNFSNIIWGPSAQLAQVGAEPITFQIATSDSATPASWDFVGPDGTDATYYNSENTQIGVVHNGKRYLRYRVFLNTADDGFTPTLSEVAFTYTNSCTPPGQSFFSGLVADTYTLEVSRAGYITNNGTVEVVDKGEAIVNLSVVE